MSDQDDDLAELLGAAPHTSDPGFRIGVLARAATRKRRRQAAVRAARSMALFGAVGLAFPLAQAAGLTWDDAAPLAAAAGALLAAYAVAVATIDGPRALILRSRAVMRV